MKTLFLGLFLSLSVFAKTVKVGMKDKASLYKFFPASVTIKAGDTVHWTNDDNVMHTVTSMDLVDGLPKKNGLFDSHIVFPKGTFDHIFAEKGVFNYYCTIHSGMRMFGQITVE